MPAVQSLIAAHRNGAPIGLYSVCSSHEQVLLAARTYGMGHLLFVARPSSRQRVAYSCHFPSIEYFKELLPD